MPDTGSARDVAAESDLGARAARLAGWCFVLLLGGLLYADFLSWLWLNAALGGVESHCAAVPLLALGLAWMRREELERVPPRRQAWGLVLAAWAGVLQLMATAADSLLASGLSLVLLLHGLVYALQGHARTRLLLGPLYFLVFMLPLRYPVEILLGFPLRLVSTQLTAWLLEIGGVPVQRLGTEISVPGFTVQVTSPCSGLNILTGLLVVAAFFAVARRLGTAASAVLLTASLPAAMLANTLRIGAIAMAGSFWGAETAMRLFHDYSGLATFALAVTLVLAVGEGLERARRRYGFRGAGTGIVSPPETAARSAARGPGPRMLHVGVLLLILVTADRTILGARRTVAVPDLEGFPGVVASIPGTPEALTDAELMLELSTGAQIVRRAHESRHGTVWLSVVASGASWRAHHPPEYCYMAQGWTVLENRARQAADGSAYRELLAEHGRERRLVHYWFTDGATSTSSLLSRWLEAMVAGFQGADRRPWLLVAVSARVRDRELLERVRPAFGTAARELLAGGQP